jgi:hypothetical protein
MPVPSSAPTRRGPHIDLSKRHERALTEIGLGPLLRDIRRAFTGKGDRKSRSVVALCRDLSAKFGSGRRSVNGELVGNVMASLVDTVQYSKSISERLREILRLGSRPSPAQLRQVLAQIYEVELWALRRQILGLRRDIPRLIENLGGDPSEELLLPAKRARKRSARKASK